MKKLLLLSLLVLSFNAQSRAIELMECNAIGEYEEDTIRLFSYFGPRQNEAIYFVEYFDNDSSVRVPCSKIDSFGAIEKYLYHCEGAINQNKYTVDITKDRAYLAVNFAEGKVFWEKFNCHMRGQ